MLLQLLRIAAPAARDGARRCDGLRPIHCCACRACSTLLLLRLLVCWRLPLLLRLLLLLLLLLSLRRLLWKCLREPQRLAIHCFLQLPLPCRFRRRRSLRCLLLSPPLGICRRRRLAGQGGRLGGQPPPGVIVRLRL